MKKTMMLVRLVLCLCVVFLSCGSYAANLEFVYVDANVGGAAGGHVAMKFANDVFHYQFFPDERFLLVREPWDHFRLIYSQLRNRSITVATCPVSEQSYRAVKGNFVKELAAQFFDLSRERALLEKQRFLNPLAGKGKILPVPGLGFFAPQMPPSSFGLVIRDRVARELGQSFLEDEGKRLKTVLRRGWHTLWEQSTTPDSRLAQVDSLIDDMRRLAAINVLENAAGLNEQTLVQGAVSIDLSQDHVQILSSFLERQLDILTKMLERPMRKDSHALLLVIARCHAIMRSIDEQVLVTLDPFPDEVTWKSFSSTDSGAKAYINRLAWSYNNEIIKYLDRLSAGRHSSSEADLVYTRIEICNGKRAELLSAARVDTGFLRLASAEMIPSKGRAVNVEDLLDSFPPSETLNALSNLVIERVGLEQAEIKQKYRYQLCKQNCVTELLRLLNDSFANKAEAQQVLGGWLDPVADRVVIPYDFFYQLTHTFRVSTIDQLPGRRLALKQDLYASEDRFLLWLREENTLTSTLYRQRGEDTPFLFFTDDLVWARPPLGLVNLTWAALHGIGGLLFSSDQRSEMFWQGARGMFYSLPELFFCNIRKGTYEYAEFSDRQSGL